MRLHISVTERVIGVRRHCGSSDREVGDKGGGQVHPRMDGLGDYTDRADTKAGDQLRYREKGV